MGHPTAECSIPRLKCRKGPKSTQNMMKAGKLFSKKYHRMYSSGSWVTSHTFDVAGQLQDNEWCENSLATFTFHHLKNFHLLTFAFSSHFYRYCF